MSKTMVLTNEKLKKVCLDSVFEVLNNETEQKSHTKIEKAIESKIDRKITSSKGTYYEKIVCKEIKKIKRFEILGGSSKKNSNFISIPNSLYNLVQNIIGDIKKGSLSLTDRDSLFFVFNRLYTESYNYRERFNEGVFSCNQDLDLGFIDKTTGDIYLYEIKSKGKFGSDVYLEHYEKYFLTFVNYVYMNKPKWDKIHINMLLVDREKDEKFKFLAYGDYGWISLSDFCKRHGIVGNLDFFKEKLHKGYTIDDDFVLKIIQRALLISKKYPASLEGSKGKFRRFYDTYFFELE